MARSYLNIDHLTKSLSHNGSTSEVLENIDLAIAREQFDSIIRHFGCSAAVATDRRLEHAVAVRVTT